MVYVSVYTALSGEAREEIMRIKKYAQPKAWRRAQSFLEYALLIAVAAGGLLLMQDYLKRSFQGQLQLTTDQMATPYAPALMNSTEHFASGSTGTEIETLGWGHPTTITNVRSHYQTDSVKKFRPLDAVLVPTNQE